MAYNAIHKHKGVCVQDFPLGAKTEQPKIEAECRERGGAASPSHQLGGFGNAVSTPGGSGRSPERLKVCNYFLQIRLWTIM